jgi:hypothetical protein
MEAATVLSSLIILGFLCYILNWSLDYCRKSVASALYVLIV